MRGRVVLSLCDFTGNWARPYFDAGYDVRLVDLKHGEDVRLMHLPTEPVHGILAAPPCTVFANSGARWPRTDDEIREGLSIVDACLRIVTMCKPTWWALENPVGKLRRYLGPPTCTFHPCDFGDEYTKKTLLWGNFAPPIPDSMFTSTRSVYPTLGSKMHLLPPSAERQALRSATPMGFAKAFFEANK